ncbi:S-layer homology domain-containing protein [Paenibacillus sp. HN-1]|uniref:S-layer homology domain-containing protein n=1 Tax=Paenibacillus TaxID=44249 RepID=UPI001CA8F454|nr:MULTISPECIES: S-layer homology domain-containing protein [Paenibacillus]MBY9077458.1 S-layer homology domain-containing protein [Paenibacillus sp. CGMCC 1.18879]MBY9084765.1 S-layer homology domain-containing protein [Paenibacillus sinensis]
MLHRLSSRASALGMALLLVISLVGGSFASGAGTAAAAASGSSASVAASGSSVSATEAVYSAAEYVLGQGVSSDWQAIGLVQAGYQLPASYVTFLESQVKAGAAKFSATDFARTVLAVKASGQDPTSYAGINLVEKVYGNTGLKGTLNGYVFSLIALGSGDYSIPAGAVWTKDKLVQQILKSQNSDGGFTLVAGSASDPDMTAMALTALSPYKGQADVAAAGKKAVAWLSKQQSSNGGYGASSESVAQAIIALTAYGIDPAGADFTKSGATLISHLLSFRLADGSFSHTLGTGSNLLATEQALEALAAYGLYAKGSGNLYDFTANPPAAKPKVQVRVDVEGPTASIGGGTVYSGIALDALNKLAQAEGFAVETKSSSFGIFVAGIGGVESARFGGYDGWMYTIQRGGKWLNVYDAVDQLALQAGDHLVFYYGDYGVTKLVDSVSYQPAEPKEGTPLQVTVNSIAWDFDGNPVTAGAAGVTVSIGGKTAVTDDKGVASFGSDLPPGSQTVEITGHRENAVPSVVRYTGSVKVTSLTIFSDEKQISPWAVASVHAVYNNKLMEGVGSGKPTFAPKAKITRAQFAALLLRLTGNEPSASGTVSFSDVKAGSWYYGYVAKAKALGLVGGVTATSFKPDAYITRQDMAVMIARAYKMSPLTKTSFTDSGKISSYALNAVNAMTEKGYMTGVGSTFDPQGLVTREMAAVVASRLP